MTRQVFVTHAHAIDVSTFVIPVGWRVRCRTHLECVGPPTVPCPQAVACPTFLSQGVTIRTTASLRNSKSSNHLKVYIVKLKSCL